MSAEKEKTDKFKQPTQTKHLPKDAQVIMSILKELGVQEYEPRIINQLLEFIYRYVTCILDDAKIVAGHARKKIIELDDVKLAIDGVLDKNFTCPPSRTVLAKLAEVRNSMPLPAIKPHCGLRLPPDRYCLTACNYKLRASNPPKKMPKSALEGRSLIKVQSKSSGAGNTTKRQSMQPPKSQLVTVPKPVIKFSSNVKSAPMEKQTINVNTNQNMPMDIKMEVDPAVIPIAASVTINPAYSSSNTVKEENEEKFEIMQ